MQIKGYKEAIKYLEGFIGKIIFKVDKEYLKDHDPLERMRVLLNLLDNPQEKFPSILVGGTSGKGSTAYLISHILTTAGYKTGLTISPHLQRINERIQINDKPISDKKFTEMVNSIVDTIELMKKMCTSAQGEPIGAPSYFEILVALSFKYFTEEKVDIAVVEVGMGGQFDATNTLNPLVAVLTNVSLDHTNVLGKTVQKIAKTKIGIIKSAEVANENFLVRSSQVNILKEFKMRYFANFVGSPRQNLIVVSGVKQPSVIKIVEDKCREMGAKLFRLGKDFGFKIEKMSHKGSVFDLIITRDRVLQLNDLKLSLLGRHQVENTSLGIETVLNLKKFGFEVSEENIKKALKTAFFPGRFEVLSITRGPVAPSSHPMSSVAGSLRALDGTPSSRATPRLSVVLDGAHNPTKMRAFLSTLKKLYPKERKIFIIGFKFDKEIKKMLREILSVADEIIVTQFKAKTDSNIHASAQAESVKYQVLSPSVLSSGSKDMKYTGKINIEKDSKKALKKAIKVSNLEKNSIVVVTGSLYLVGEVRDML